MDCFETCAWYIRSAYQGVCNGQPLWRVPLSVAVGMWPIFAWLFAFKKAVIIPINWRPEIHTEWLPVANDALVSIWGVLFGTLCVSPFAWKLWVSARDRAESAEPLSDALWWASKQKVAAVALVCYPAALSILDFLADTKISIAKDVAAFVTYGALHFASPFLGAIGLWIWAPPEVGATFAWTLGFTNLSSLCTHLVRL